jgi:hypothetical protein
MLLYQCPSLNQVLTGCTVVVVGYVGLTLDNALYLYRMLRFQVTSLMDIKQFLVLWIYRLTFHPLAKYPGSFLYKLTDWPLILQAYHGNRHLYHLKDHEKYGKLSHRKGLLTILMVYCKVRLSALGLTLFHSTQKAPWMQFTGARKLTFAKLECTSPSMLALEP